MTPVDSAAGTPCLLHGQTMFHTVPGNCQSVSLVPIIQTTTAKPTTRLNGYLRPDGSWGLRLETGHVWPDGVWRPW